MMEASFTTLNSPISFFSSFSRSGTQCSHSWSKLPGLRFGFPAGCPPHMHEGAARSEGTGVKTVEAKSVNRSKGDPWGRNPSCISGSQRDLGTEQMVEKKVGREQEKSVLDFSRECTQLEALTSVLLRAWQVGCMCVHCPNSTGQGLGCK